MNKYIEPHKEWINQIFEKCQRKLRRVSEQIDKREIIPYISKNGSYMPAGTTDDKGCPIPDYTWWTNGFWGGLMWLLYLDTKDEHYKLCAQNQEKLLDRAFDNIDGLHHDVGFMWHLTSGASYRITADKKSRTRNLVAASMLASRYNISGGFIRAWNRSDGKGWTIIDTMLNIHLLYWATSETGDERFEKIADSHAHMVMRDHVRPDGSVAHIVSHNTENGDVIETFAGQGYEVGSSWSRGQGWALYGFILGYIHTGKQEYLDTAKRIAHYFIACICDDYLPKADFRAPDEPVIIDSTAAGLAACGLIEIARAVPEFEKKIYINAAIKILKATESVCACYDEDEEALILKGSHSYHRKEQREIPMVYADFYFMEALYKLRGGDFLIW